MVCTEARSGICQGFCGQDVPYACSKNLLLDVTGNY